VREREVSHLTPHFHRHAILYGTGFSGKTSTCPDLFIHLWQFLRHARLLRGFEVLLVHFFVALG
jgi:hypothetical protein